MSDYSEVTYDSWFSRVAESIKSVVFGFTLVGAAIYGLWWNEGNSVKTLRGLAELRDQAVSVSSDKVDAANEGAVVHLSGATQSATPLNDETFGLKVNALQLRRTVEMYQWSESKQTSKRKDLAGGTKTVKRYTYKRKWSSSHIDSSDFHKPSARQNKVNPQFRYESGTKLASPVTIGAFTLNREFVDSFNNFAPIAPPETLPASLKGAQRSPEKIYIGADPTNPKVGDLRITFEAVKHQPVSVIAQQVKSELKSYRASNDKVFTVIQAGEKDIESIFAQEKKNNSTFTWIVRFVGVLAMFFGFLIIFNPLVVVADIIPFVGGLLGAGAALVAAVFAFVVSSSVIAVAWFFHRPLLSAGLIAGIIAVIFWARGRGSQSSSAAPEPAEDVA